MPYLWAFRCNVRYPTSDPCGCPSERVLWVFAWTFDDAVESVKAEHPDVEILSVNRVGELDIISPGAAVR